MEKDNQIEEKQEVEQAQEEAIEEVKGEPVDVIEQLKQEASDYKRKYLEQLADSENARKRLQKERQELIQYAIQNIILDFLHPIDHLENALQYTEQASDEVKHWATGFQMILNQFRDVLSNNGVTPINAIGKPFDPHLHEAIEMMTTTEYPPGTVVEENIRGYLMGEKTLRPSRVKVSQEPKAEKSETVQEENQEAKS